MVDLFTKTDIDLMSKQMIIPPLQMSRSSFKSLEATPYSNAYGAKSQSYIGGEMKIHPKARDTE